MLRPAVPTECRSADRTRMKVYKGHLARQYAGNSQYRAWQCDLARFRKAGYSGWGSEGFWALTIYRSQRGCRTLPTPMRQICRLGLGAAKKLLTLVTHINLHPDAVIGPGTLIPHVGSIQVFPWATIGADCAIHQVCTIGAGPKPGGPTLGDHVYLGAHVCILGGITIGDGAVIGAGAVVVTDIPAWATAVGVPAKVVRIGTPRTGDDADPAAVAENRP